MRTLFSPNQRSSFFRNGSEMTKPQTPESRNQPPESEDGTVEKGDRACFVGGPWTVKQSIPGYQQHRYVIPQMTVRVLFQATYQLCAELAWGLVPFCHEEILYSF